VQALGVDFYAFQRPTSSTARRASGVLLGPAGGPRRKCRRTRAGGDMIESVTFEKTTYASCPTSSRRGTPDIAGAGPASGAAVDLRPIRSGFEAFRARDGGRGTARLRDRSPATSPGAAA